VGLVEGYPDKTFRPTRTLTRAELATLLVRAKGISIPSNQANEVFRDVKPSHWAAKYIEVAQREGLIKGYPDKTFRPNNKITKAEGIAVVARFENLPVPFEVNETPYSDVKTTNWSAKYIQAAKGAGLLTYVKGQNLFPQQEMARSEAVELLSKTTLAGGKIKELYRWDEGFGSSSRGAAPDKPQGRASLF
ncbi:MAG: S-layer homology domain-containing protein, partial [Candidatus Margulisbacteria bacterium]|nr:S-layer homology domain-containing protein [Candidatus Margulisiibacteriota bacterium]